MTSDTQSAIITVKPRYELLDGLRGIAAVLVIWYHFFEAFATSPTDQMMNHGYLAVDFFFVLSGFVLGYAYDDRWKKDMTASQFMLRRVIRLHPMVILAVVLGAVAYLIQGSVRWDGTPMPASMLAVALILGMLLIPIVPGTDADVRGNGEMFPLNGPSWSLFFEYIGNILYALVLRRLSTRALAALVALTGAGLAAFAVGDLSGFGHLGVGWSLGDHNLLGGLLRLAFSFPAGLLLARNFRPVAVRGAFWICSAALALLLAVPHAGGAEALWLNGIYDSVCVLVCFPALLWLGASGRTTDRTSTGVCRFLGDISYPVYIIHYPSMYLFYAWLWRGEPIGFDRAWPVAAGLFAGNIVLAYGCLKLYDEPVRRWLARRFLDVSK